jgi:hypothetical protein
MKSIYEIMNFAMVAYNRVIDLNFCETSVGTYGGMLYNDLYIEVRIRNIHTHIRDKMYNEITK